MQSPEELLRANAIQLASYASGRHYATCPHCSHQRQKRHQKLKCLGVTIDGDRVRWGCNHCNWTGPERGSGNGADREPRSEFKAVYQYNSTLRKVRNPDGKEPKFFWQHRNSVGNWVSGTGNFNTTNLLYRIDEFLEATADGAIGVIVEGEKDVETVWELGIPATCNAHGASELGKTPKWTRAHAKQLLGRNLVVLNDNDEAGVAHAQAVLDETADYAKWIEPIDLFEFWPDDTAPKGCDVTEIRAKALSDEDLTDILTSGPPQSKLERELFDGDAALEEVSLGTVVQGVLHAGSTSLIYGPAKSGKSFLATDLLLAVAAGDPDWMGHKIVKSGPVLYIACEGHAGFWKRLRAAKERRGSFPQNFSLWRGRPHLIRFDDGGYHAFPHAADILEVIAIQTTKGRKPVAIVIDTVFRAIGGGDVSKSEHINAFLAALSPVLDRGIAVLLIHHETKAGGSPTGSVALMGAADTIIRTANLDDKSHTWEVEFAKDDASSDASRFKLDVVPVPTSDSNPASSCIVIPLAGRVPKGKQRALNDEEHEFREILIDTFATVGRDLAPLEGMPLRKTITRDELKAALTRKGWFSEPEANGVIKLKSPESRDLGNKLRTFKRRNLIAYDGPFIWLLDPLPH